METDGAEKETLEQLLAQYREKTKRPVIHSLNRRLGYLEARKVAEPYGGLPRNVTHEYTQVGSNDWSKPELEGYYPAYAREMPIYPGPGKTLKKGEDVIDPSIDEKGRRWVYPSYLIPEEAIGRANKALFVNPRKIIEEEKEVTVIADPDRDVTVLSDFPQKSDWTRTFGSYNFVWRLNTAGVRPLVRGCGGFYGGRRGVDALYRHDDGFGVGYESLEETPQDLESLTIGQLRSALKKG